MCSPAMMALSDFVEELRLNLVRHRQARSPELFTLLPASRMSGLFAEVERCVLMCVYQ